MLVVHKYLIDPHDIVTAQMPADARILAVQEQREMLCIWALTDTAKPPMPRLFRIVRTGHPADFAQKAVYVGTVQLRRGLLVLHVFDLGEPQ